MPPVDCKLMQTADSILQQAWQLHQQGQVQRAETIYRQVLQQAPNHPSAWCFLGIALHDQHRYRDAIAAYQKSIQLQPNFPIALNNLGNSLRYDYRPEEAEQCFQRAIQLKPDYVNAHKNRGTLHVWNGNLELAYQCYEAAMRLNPQDAELHRNLGVLGLLQGDFENGWREYRWRWRCPEMPRPKYAAPVWNGESLEGKTILLYAEQGLGDTLHFIRYAKILKDRGARIMVHGPVSLTALVRKVPGVDLWIPQSMTVDLPFDYHCSLVDCADILGTDLNTIPNEVPYLQAAPYLIDYWKDYFKQFPAAKLRVGLVWQGNRDHQADAFRSFPLTTYEPLSQVPGIQLFSLQFGYGSEQTKCWQGRTPIHLLPEGLDQSSGPFMDTSAILHHMDLVITSDTSMVHLCGALGRPAWLLLNLVPDWRWLLQREDSPWYPSIRLFRQTEQANWSSVVQRIVEALGQFDPADPNPLPEKPA